MDNDFEFEIDSDSEYSESSSDVSSEEIEEVIEAPRKGCITKGGKTATASWPVKSQKEICELELESTRKEQDLTPVVQVFLSYFSNKQRVNDAELLWKGQLHSSNISQTSVQGLL